jgi:hypothetical protein
MTCAMVRRWSVVLMMAMAIVCAVPCRGADAPPAPESIRAAAQSCADAMLKGDFEAFANFTHPRLIEMFGGRQKFIATIKKGNEDMKAQKAAITSFTVRAPDGTTKGGADLFAVVPTTLAMTIRDSKIKQDGYLIGVSSDNGAHWTFVTGDGIERAKLKEILPNLPEELKLPAKAAQVVEKK